METDMDCAAIWKEANEAGLKAVKDYTDKYPHSLCGFAWITIRPARGKFVTYLKSVNAGHTGVYGGYEVSLRGTNTQCIEAKIAGTRAMADVLKSHGINLSVADRLD